jgi:hypothetical protein
MQLSKSNRVKRALLWMVIITAKTVGFILLLLLYLVIGTLLASGFVVAFGLYMLILFVLLWPGLVLWGVASLFSLLFGPSPKDNTATTSAGSQANQKQQQTNPQRHCEDADQN